MRIDSSAIGRRTFLLALVAAAALALPAADASANALDEAKARGELGERYDGYLGVVKGGDAVKALAADINQKRQAHYARIAIQEGTRVEAVAAIAGARLVESAPSGQYVQPSAGAAWKRVP